jgi:hypothetical protein
VRRHVKGGFGGCPWNKFWYMNSQKAVAIAEKYTPLRTRATIPKRFGDFFLDLVIWFFSYVHEQTERIAYHDRRTQCV